MIFRQKNTIFLKNYNLTPLDMYNGLSQVYLHQTRRKNPLIYKGLRKPELKISDLAQRLYNFSCSTQLSMQFILLIHVKMPTIVGILIFIGMINTTSERLKARSIFICRYFSFYEQLKFHAQFS